MLEDRDATAMSQPVLYYRLKQLDTDGSSDYSELIELRLDPRASDIKIGPIPANDRIYFDLSPNLKGRLSVRMHNLQAKEVLNSSLMESYELDIGELRPGSYFISIYLKDFYLIIKICSIQ